jgi:5-methylcytosine-specific restriction endonuclease McrA
MPILPENKKRYPKNWSLISARIRARAGDACEWCDAQNGEPHPVTGAKVVLTVAHLNHNPGDNRDQNLAALCQKCHNSYDAPTRTMKKEVKRQVWDAMHIACTWRRGLTKRRISGNSRRRPTCTLREHKPKRGMLKLKLVHGECCFTHCPLMKAYRKDYR